MDLLKEYHKPITDFITNQVLNKTIELYVRDYQIVIYSCGIEFLYKDFAPLGMQRPKNIITHNKALNILNDKFNNIDILIKTYAKSDTENRHFIKNQLEFLKDNEPEYEYEEIEMNEYVNQFFLDISKEKQYTNHLKDYDLIEIKGILKVLLKLKWSYYTGLLNLLENLIEDNYDETKKEVDISDMKVPFSKSCLTAGQIAIFYKLLQNHQIFTNDITNAVSRYLESLTGISNKSIKNGLTYLYDIHDSESKLLKGEKANQKFGNLNKIKGILEEMIKSIEEIKKEHN